jgi:hypothetical protein
MVTAAVFFAKIGGPIIGGIFAMFPAMFLSTIIISNLTYGNDFSKAIAKNTMITSVSIVIFSFLVRYSFLLLGAFLGTILSIVGTMLSGYLVYSLILKRLK